MGYVIFPKIDFRWNTDTANSSENNNTNSSVANLKNDDELLSKISA